MPPIVLSLAHAFLLYQSFIMSAADAVVWCWLVLYVCLDVPVCSAFHFTYLKGKGGSSPAGTDSICSPCVIPSVMLAYMLACLMYDA